MPKINSMGDGESNSFNFGWVLGALAALMPQRYLARGVQAMIGYWYDADNVDPEPDLMIDILFQCALKGRYDKPENLDLEEEYGILFSEDPEDPEEKAISDEAAVQAFLDLLAGVPEAEEPDTPKEDDSTE